MSTTLRVFRIPSSAGGGRSVPEEIRTSDALTVDGSGDAAKDSARASLTKQGYSVRAMSWSPDPRPERPPVLVVYVSPPKA